MLRKNKFAEKVLYGKIFFCLVGKRRGGGGEMGGGERNIDKSVVEQH